MIKPEKYIILGKCIHGGLYKLQCRNLSIGIFDKYSNSFVGIRTKFTQRFLDNEFHWETGAPYGTCFPLELLEETEFKGVSTHEPWSSFNSMSCEYNMKLFEFLKEREI